MGLITGFKPSKKIDTSVRLRTNKSISKSKDRRILSATSVIPKPSKHLKTPRKGKYQNIRLFNKKQKLKHEKYYNDMKLHHYEHFIKSFTKNVSGTKVELADGEAEEIMRDYILNKRATDKPSKMAQILTSARELQTHESVVPKKLSPKDYSSNMNSSSTKMTSCKNRSKRIRPKTVNRLRARNQTKLYTIKEDSALLSQNHVPNQKSTANDRFDEIKSMTNDDLNLSSIRDSKYSSVQKLYSGVKTKPTKRIRRKVKKEEEIIPDKYINPEIIKSLAGKSEGMRNVFDKKK